MADKTNSESSQTKRTTLKSYASRVFEESSVGLVSSLAHTASARRRVFKVSALIFCLTGFFYQSGTFLAAFFQYPTTVDIDIKRPEWFNLPAYTFCDNNGINRKIFCQKYPDYCEKPDEVFCKKYENYCGENETLVPKKKYYSFISNLTLEQMIDLNVNMTSFVTDLHRSDEQINGPFLRITGFALDTLYLSYFMCYSLNDRVNSSLVALQTRKNELRKVAVNSLEFTVRQEEIFLPGSRTGVLFAIHSPFQAVNPFETGIFMKPGRTYMVFVSMEEEVLLKEPYDTNCVNYTEMWVKNGYSGPRLQDMCKQKCIAEISMKCHNCVVPIIWFPTDYSYCTPDDFLRENCPDNVMELLEECNLKCRDDCRRTKYSYTVQERFSTNFDIEGEVVNNLDSTIKVEVYVESDEVIVLKHSPKYMIVEVFSNIGGFIGCWLGINLLDITDIFEGFFRILRHSFKRR